jgi:hypothetical protein
MKNSVLEFDAVRMRMAASKVLEQQQPTTSKVALLQQGPV